MLGVCAERKLCKAKIRMDADALGRQDVGCYQFLGVLRGKNPKPKNGTEAVFGQRKG
jgi:hypothetical protein